MTEFQKVNVLFISHMAPAFSEMLPFILFCKQRQLFEPHVYFDHDINHASDQVNFCLRNKINIYNLHGIRVNDNENQRTITRFDRCSFLNNIIYTENHKRKLKSFREFIIDNMNSRIKLAIQGILSAKRDISYLLRSRKSIKKILSIVNPGIVILGCDMVHLDTTLINKICLNKIPVVTLTWIFGNGEDPANVLYNSDLYPLLSGKLLLNKLIAKIFPKYLYFYKDHRILRLPALEILVREICGLGVPRPWVFNSGYSTSIIVDSSFMYNFYLKAGIPSNQLLAIGTPIQDTIAAILKDKKKFKMDLYKKFDFDFHKKLALVAIPPDCFHMLKNPSVLGFSKYNELFEYWVTQIKKIEISYNVLFSVHPGISDCDRKIMQKHYNIDIISSDESTASIIPLADVFITSVSSTIRWAIACSLAVIDFDIYNFNNQLGKIGGVKVVQTRSSFEKVLHDLVASDFFLECLKNDQQKHSKEFGFLDGLACERLQNYLLKIIL